MTNEELIEASHHVCVVIGTVEKMPIGGNFKSNLTIRDKQFIVRGKYIYTFDMDVDNSNNEDFIKLCDLIYKYFKNKYTAELIEFKKIIDLA